MPHLLIQRPVLLLTLVLTILAASLHAGQAQDKSDVLKPIPLRRAWWNTYGITFVGDKFVMSLSANGATLHSVDVKGSSDSVPFAPDVRISGGTVETGFVHPIASSIGLGGFPCRDIYVGAGNDILHVAGDSLSSNTFVTGLDGVVRALLFDTVGSFNWRLIAATQTGSVYIIDGQGTIKRLAALGEDIKAMDVIPAATGFGSYDRQLLVISEDSGLVRSIDSSGAVTLLNDTHRFLGGEALFIVPQDLGDSRGGPEGLFQIYWPLDILRSDVSDLLPYRGDALIASQHELQRQIWRMHWNGSGLEFKFVSDFWPRIVGMTLVTPAMIHPPVECSTGSPSRADTKRTDATKSADRQ